MHPYLAMTAHWLGPRGDDHQVLLRQALLAFRRIRGAHSGQRIARIVYNILENADIINKVGHFSFFPPPLIRKPTQLLSGWAFYPGQCFQQCVIYAPFEHPPE